MNPARLVALYLPQYHPVPENDAWWGRGFTEWTNTAKAKPLYPGHYQPHVPADLGFYDLRVPESRVAQADLARAYGIEAFCYYHYWFAGRRILERPFNEVLRSGEPDFPFCLCWANESWTGIWHGDAHRMLVEQTYPGDDDHRAHFDAILPAFRDSRYLRVDGKPFFAVYKPMQVPDVLHFTRLWRRWAREAGLDGLHLVGVERGEQEWSARACGFDASFRSALWPRRWVSWRHPLRKLAQQAGQRWQDLTGRVTAHSWRPTTFRYEDHAVDWVLPSAPGAERYPCIMPNWDNTPRSGGNGIVMHGSTPERFRVAVRAALDAVAERPAERRIVMLKSWNEWAEGNHLEPDLRFGRGFLEVLHEELRRSARPVPEAAATPDLSIAFDSAAGR